MTTCFFLLLFCLPVNKAVFLIGFKRVRRLILSRRHCLWILGNATTLAGGKTIWREIVADAKERGCFYDAKDDKDLSNAIIKAVIELDEVESLLKMDGLRIGGSRPGVWLVTCPCLIKLFGVNRFVESASWINTDYSLFAEI